MEDLSSSTFFLVYLFISFSDLVSAKDRYVIVFFYPSFLFQSLKSTFTFKHPFLPFRFQISRSGLNVFEMLCAFFVFISSPHRLCIASCVFGNLDQLSSSCVFLMFSLFKVTLLEGGRGGFKFSIEFNMTIYIRNITRFALF